MSRLGSGASKLCLDAVDEQRDEVGDGVVSSLCIRVRSTRKRNEQSTTELVYAQARGRRPMITRIDPRDRIQLGMYTLQDMLDIGDRPKLR